MDRLVVVPTAELVDALRARGVYPAVVGGMVRLYGQGNEIPIELLEALRSRKPDVLAYLRHPAQAIAYDLIELATQAGWEPWVVEDGGVVWRRGDEETANPMLPGPLHDAYDHHVRQVRAVLRLAPRTCPCREHCTMHGICLAEIRESACSLPTHECVA